MSIEAQIEMINNIKEHLISSQQELHKVSRIIQEEETKISRSEYADVNIADLGKETLDAIYVYYMKIDDNIKSITNSIKIQEEELRRMKIEAQQRRAPASPPLERKLKHVIDNDNYVVAVRTDKGILQVKEVIAGVANFTKKFYRDEDAWRATLLEL